METIQYILSKLLIVIIVVAVLIFGFMLVNKFAPNFFPNFSLAGRSFFTDDWLPDPVDMQGAAKGTTANLSGNVYEGSLTPGTSYVVYTDAGMKIVNVPPKNPTFNPEKSGYADSSTYVRNLSVYKNESIRNGMTFYGETRSTFFTNGIFYVYLLDAQGKVFAKETATAMSQWSVPGWTRFAVTIRSLLPTHQQCQLFFLPEPNSPDRASGMRALVPVTCN